jgi:hypothetical protein
MKARLLLALPLALLLTGCPGGTEAPDDSADQARLSFLRNEKILGKDDKPSETLGFRISDKSPAERTTVLARIYRNESGDPARDTQQATLAGVGQLRSTGWTVYFAACVPPSTGAATGPAEIPGVPQAQAGQWFFGASAYKIQDDVSYWATLRGESTANRANVLVTLIAPHSTEPTSNLFADRPTAINTSCLDNPLPTIPSSPTETTGTPIVVDDEGPDPNNTPKPPNHR